MELPKFTAPAPFDGEIIHVWHGRVIQELERWVNEALAPAIADAAASNPIGGICRVFMEDGVLRRVQIPPEEFYRSPDEGGE